MKITLSSLSISVALWVRVWSIRCHLSNSNHDVVVFISDAVAQSDDRQQYSVMTWGTSFDAGIVKESETACRT